MPSISATELHDLLQGPSGKNVVMVDTRTDEERAVSRIPGKVLSKDEFEDQKASYKNSTVVAYCTGVLLGVLSQQRQATTVNQVAKHQRPCSTAGLRSGKYLKPLRAEGYDTRNLKGSIVAWVSPLLCHQMAGVQTQYAQLVRPHPVEEGWVTFITAVSQPCQ